ncbi:MAG TPA: DUF4160 domain-containing protein [Stellaceae bacterium]|nr:DUF4160 domain-containing protein [Stellaceae bacterium]
MFYDEHGPPHFHVAYQGCQAVIDIRTLEVRMGRTAAARSQSRVGLG